MRLPTSSRMGSRAGMRAGSFLSHPRFNHPTQALYRVAPSRGRDSSGDTVNTLLKGLVTFVALCFGFGLVVAGGAMTTAAGDSEVVGKRDEDGVELVLVANDDDDGDDNSRNSRDGASRSKDATNSRFSAVSRDRDRSRGDLTRDMTRDGGDRTRDFSRNLTNDRSRNDTR
jgi:hypothetical protein